MCWNDGQNIYRFKYGLNSNHINRISVKEHNKGTKTTNLPKKFKEK